MPGENEGRRSARAGSPVSRGQADSIASTAARAAVAAASARAAVAGTGRALPSRRGSPCCALHDHHATSTVPLGSSNISSTSTIESLHSPGTSGLGRSLKTKAWARQGVAPESRTSASSVALATSSS